MITLKCFGKCIRHAIHTQRYLPKPQYFGTTIWLRNNEPPLPPVTVNDINADEMMDADDDFAADFDYRYREGGIENPFSSGGIVGSDGQPISSTTDTVKTSNMYGAPIAPVDINGWDDEEDIKECTVDYENMEKYKDTIEYPPVPNERASCYEFRGIKIMLPKRCITKGTYRYRLTKEDEETLADDTRICRFEPKAYDEASPAEQTPYAP